jgi:Holliday junction resolvase RusA-like endonuclease
VAEDRVVIDFFLDLIPPDKTAQQKGARGFIDDKGKARVQHYKKTEIKEIELMYCGALVAHRPAVPLRGPIKADITFTWPWRAKDSESRRKWGWWPKDSKPDWDNCGKELCDCLKTVGFFAKDDAQIADGRVRKGVGNRPGIRVKLSEWSFDPTEKDA